MLIDSIRTALFGAHSPAQPGADPLQLAACALLLEIAHADGEFSAGEREHLERVLATHFSLPPDAGRELLELAEKERKGSVDYFRFTSVLRDGYDTEQKMSLAETMWGLVLADGQVAEHEHYLTRKIANLLDLEPASLSAAKAVAARARDL
jgi:uncharacterized tellurite resistance protein B-like protein